MRIYRVSTERNNGDGHGGYWFISNKREISKLRKEHEDLTFGEPVPFTLKPTKAGILAALNREAGHADNG